ncbi:hypothetical protein [uncultured Roseibium sp.]|uniref:hypothetical protein n=1 Tax=uncultured Roseibium sp. TaxID=1936171 RepID=UPI0026278E9F|nr:hypothetical protein [uncultured Roseibium sp.]
MAQNNLGTIDPTTTTGTDLATLLSNFDAAVISGHSGPSRPTYASQGLLWTGAVSATDHRVQYFDGTEDITLITVNPTDNTISLAVKALTVDGSPVWHSGNDGAGSGLDADTVDGLHASAFVNSGTNTDVTATWRFLDNIYTYWGNSHDMGIGHNGSSSYMWNNTGHFYIQNRHHSNSSGIYIQDEDSAGTNHSCALFEHDRVLLYYDNAVKLQTDGSGVTVTGRVHATDRMYVGNNGGGDSWTSYYDDNSNTWREFGWDDSQNCFVAEENDGGIHKVGLVDTQSSTGATNFPIGHTLIASANGNPDRNGSRSLHLYTGNNDQYVDSTSPSGNKGSTLVGTWRARGLANTNIALYCRIG